MTTAEKIQPALTPEQWASKRFVDADDHCAIDTAKGWIGLAEFSGSASWYGVSEGARHAMAAICLAGQPCGFTRADLKAVVEGITGVEYAHSNVCGGPDECAGFKQQLESLYDRIAALLPPE